MARPSGCGMIAPMPQLRDLVHLKPKRGLEFPHWVDRLLSVGIVSTDPQIVRCQRCVNIAAYATAATAVSHLVSNSIHDFRGLLIINVYNLISICGAMLVPRLHRFGEHVGAIALILLILIIHSLVVWSFGLSSGLQIYFTLGGAILYLLGVQNWRLFLVFFGMFVVALLVSLNFAPMGGLDIPGDLAYREHLSNQAVINTIIINAALLFYALDALRRAEVDLQDQHERSEALVQTVMPRPIAERLKSGEERIADRIEMLTVLFYDLAGFTGAAHDLPPEKVVDFLDGLICAFDTLAEQHGVEKIKTIGDSYMAAAGFGGDAAKKAVAVGRFALAMLAATEDQPPLAGRKLKMRIGIHCGDATAGIIGSTRFSYDVWGDAVNFASRMESHGMPGRIQVSEAYHALTLNAFHFEERGTTDIRGLGAARTYFLLRERTRLDGTS
jgi:adenylate cyclase